MTILTIVIPIYNVEKYLASCIQSIINQEEFEQCEILLIDDGSKDASTQICDEFASKYENIVALHKTNGGLSDARNYGLEHANGDYVFFLDADDYIDNDALKSIFNLINKKNIDVLMFDALCVDEEGHLIKKPEFEFVHRGLVEGKIYDGEEVLKSQLCVGGMQTTVWLAIYSREYLLNEQLWFEKGLLHEDELWTPVVVSKAKRVVYIQQKLYCYRIRENSIMRNKNSDNTKNVESYIYVYSYLMQFYQENIKDSELKKSIMNDLCSRYLYVINKWQFFKYPALIQNVDCVALLKNSISLKNKLRAVLAYVRKTISVN